MSPHEFDGYCGPPVKSLADMPPLPDGPGPGAPEPVTAPAQLTGAVLWLWVADELVLMTARPTRDEALTAAADWLRERPTTAGLHVRVRVEVRDQPTNLPPNPDIPAHGDAT
jgi:hypothetical protein